MRCALTIHPDSPPSPVKSIDVEIARANAGTLSLRYVATGRIGDLLLPPPALSGRADGLWQHTCFEAFIRPAGGAAYREFNFAPSTQWAAYGFSSTREGMHAVDLAAPPRPTRPCCS